MCRSRKRRARPEAVQSAYTRRRSPNGVAKGVHSPTTELAMSEHSLAEVASSTLEEMDTEEDGAPGLVFVGGRLQAGGYRHTHVVPPASPGTAFVPWSPSPPARRSNSGAARLHLEDQPSLILITLVVILYTRLHDRSDYLAQR